MSATEREKRARALSVCCWASAGPRGSRARGEEEVGWPFYFFEPSFFSLFQKQNKDNFCLKTPNEFK